MRIPIDTPEQAERQHIHNFVTAFYSAVRQNPVIGPIFNNAIGDRWDEHFDTLTDFWMTVLLRVHVFKGNPFLAHSKLSDLRDEHFDIWLGIFEQVAPMHLRPDLSDLAIQKAHMIATSLRQGLFYKVAG